MKPSRSAIPIVQANVTVRSLLLFFGADVGDGVFRSRPSRFSRGAGPAFRQLRWARAGFVLRFHKGGPERSVFQQTECAREIAGGETFKRAAPYAMEAQAGNTQFKGFKRNGKTIDQAHKLTPGLN